MIRTFFTLLYCVIYLVGTIPVQIVLFIMRFIGLKKAASWIGISFVRPFFRPILWIAGVKVNVIGLDNIPKDKSVLFVGNHTSYYDIIINYCFFPRPTGFVAKDSLAKIPLLSCWMLLVDCVFLNRKDIKKGLQTIIKAIDNVNRGVSMFIFPEGTRNKNEDERVLLKFRDGALKIAEKSKCMIVPVAMTGNSNILEKHFPKITSARVTLEYGKPIDISQMDRAELKQLGNTLSTTLSDMIGKHEPYINR